MITYSSAWLLTAVVIILGAAVFTRGLGTRTTARHRGGRELIVPLTDLMPDWPTPVAGVVRQGFGWCDPCARVMAGVITRDGFRCDCGTPAGGARS